MSTPTADRTPRRTTGQPAKDALAQGIYDRCIPEPNSGCWLWLQAIDPTGYGVSWFRNAKIGAHRKSWIVFRGEIAEGLSVLHKCDNPMCVNPDHLFLGNAFDNAQDCKLKKRHQHGMQHVRAMLSDDDVRFIRRSSVSSTALGKQFSVAASTIRAARHRQSWRHIK